MIVHDCCNCETDASVRHTLARRIEGLAIQAQARSHADTHTRRGRRADCADLATVARIQCFQAHTFAAGRSWTLIEFTAGSKTNSPQLLQTLDLTLTDHCIDNLHFFIYNIS